MRKEDHTAIYVTLGILAALGALWYFTRSKAPADINTTAPAPPQGSTAQGVQTITQISPN